MRGINRLKFQGYTLVELMIVVVIISVLAAIAVPAYQNYVKKSRRSDAKAALLQLQLAEEKYRANNAAYGSLVNLGLIPNSTTTYYSPDSYYILTVPTANATAYTLTATYNGIQTADTHCKTLSIDQNGTKTATDSSDAVVTDCW